MDKCYVLFCKERSWDAPKILGIFISEENAKSNLDRLKEEYTFSKIYIEEHLFVDRS